MSWNWAGFEGKHIPVDVFTNADSVELFLNGKSLGVKSLPADLAPQIEEHQNKDRTVSLLQSPSIHVSWDVAYAPGELKAIATKGGKTVAEDVVHTAGDPSKLVLTADRSSIQNNQDLSFIKVAIVDKDGFSCPNADNEITFSLKGNAATIVGLDNGDATNLESFKGTRHKAYHGLALAVLKSKFDSTGQVILTASADGLPPALITITVTPQSGSQ